MDTTPFGFGEAINRLKKGATVAREHWNGKNQSLGLQKPDANSANSLPYIYIITVEGERVPWVASQTDMLADDWFVVVPAPQEGAAAA